ncbi:MAG: MerR family transcriptional regulator [Desulfobulbaceae bacterium]|uniref:MerR family transcriptional regulator n=1 Tax=Candidatus Desulfatifera sulfidica TaxID=2841691 RepID=A0A8J6T9A5_9BACT|nr:MerR family transcriptional regulator [Candidatus Desulfatifera sulfidica]
MVKKKTDVQAIKPDMAIYPIGVAARLLSVHPRTLRIYEEEGLVEPAHHGTRRLYSPNNVQWISCLRSLIHDEGISIPGLKKLLQFAPCWEIADCPREVCEGCTAQIDRATAQTLHIKGDKASEKQAKAADRARRDEERRIQAEKKQKAR